MKGKAYRCTGRMDGEGRQKGFDCHTSPKGNEIIIFVRLLWAYWAQNRHSRAQRYQEPDQILPRYIITFESKEAEEREQEG